MLTSEINGLLGKLSVLSQNLEDIYIENEGEVTEQTEGMEEEIEAIRQLLTTEGVDSLGRWLKSVEDSVKSLKAEKDYLTRRINASSSTIDYIKTIISRIMKDTGTEVIKGTNGYAFRSYVSETTSVDKETLNAMYGEPLREAMIKANIPSYVTFTLGASVKAVPAGQQLPDIFRVSREDAVRFTKPRAAKEL